MQDTVVVALGSGIVTGAAALVASWLTSRSNIQAARVQADTAAVGQRRDRMRESRRVAYVDFVAYTNELRYFARTIVDLAAEGDPGSIASLRAKRIELYREFERRRNAVHLEGPAGIEEATQAIYDALDRLADDLVSAVDCGSIEKIKHIVRAADAEVRTVSARFVDVARLALEQT